MAVFNFEKERVNKLLCYSSENEKQNEIFQKVLGRIKPLEKYFEAGRNMKLSKIEKTVALIVRKYEITLQYMSFLFVDGEKNHYSVSVRNDIDMSWLGTVYGLTLYDTWVKLAIMLYGCVIRGEIKKRENELLEP